MQSPMLSPVVVNHLYSSVQGFKVVGNEVVGHVVWGTE